MSTQIEAPQEGKPLPERGTRPPLRLEFLDGLRGLAALYVVLFHLFNCEGLPRWANICLVWLRMGHSAVTVFIVLSGFSLMIPVARSVDRALKGGTSGYLKRRAWRIMPPYYAAIVLSLLVLALSPQGVAYLHGVRDGEWMSNFGWPALVSHLFLFDNLKLRWSSRINVPMWSVATEWQIYFLLPLVLLPIWRRFGNGPMLAVGLLVGMLPITSAFWHQNLTAACLWYVGIFSLGAFGAILSFDVNAQQPSPLTSNKSLLCIAAAALLAYLLVVKDLPTVHLDPGASDFGTRFYITEALKDTCIGIGAVCLIVFCAQERHAMAPPFILRLLQSRFARFFGSFSYSMYLTHILVEAPTIHWVQVQHLSPLENLMFRGLVSVPAAIGLAYVFYLAFERPFLVKRKQEKKQETQAARISTSVSL